MLHCPQVNKTQRQNLAKYFYDLSKVVITIAAITNVFSSEFDVTNFWLGVVATIILYLIGFFLDGKGE